MTNNHRHAVAQDVRTVAQTTAFLLLSICLGSSLGEEMTQPQLASHSLEQLKRGLAERYHEISNVTMKYTAQEQMVHGDPISEFATKNVAGMSGRADFLGDSQLAYPWLVAEHRLDGGRRFSKIVTPQLGIVSNVPPMPDLNVEWIRPNKKNNIRFFIRAWNDEIYSELTPGGTGVLSEDNSVQLLDNLIFQYLDFPVHELRLRQEDNLYLPSSIENSEPKVLAELENVYGQWCHVIDVPDTDRLWVDVARGFALVKRESRWAKDGPMRRELSATNWTEVGNGLWLPSQIVATFYCSPTRHPDRAGKVSSRVEINAAYSGDPLDDDKFSVEFPEGILVRDRRTGKEYVHGELPLDLEDAAARALAEMNQYSSGVTSRRALWIAFNVIVVISLFLAVLWQRSKKSREMTRS